jgi:hypothetical protein
MRRIAGQSYLVGVMMPALLVFQRRDAQMAEAEGEGEDMGQEGAQPNPRAKLMHEVAEQMDAIEADFGDGYAIGRVITIVEVQRPDGEVGIRVRAGMYPWVAIGMLEVAKKIVEGGGEPG